MAAWQRNHQRNGISGSWRQWRQQRQRSEAREWQRDIMSIWLKA